MLGADASTYGLTSWQYWLGEYPKRLYSNAMETHVSLEKSVGETPLDCLERYRAQRPDLRGVPMAYAGRLDPMASGALLVLIGDACKRQTMYHNLDKAYEFSVLLGIGSDTADVLGRLHTTDINSYTHTSISLAAQTLIGTITLPYPIFSAKTVRGKPLHTWALEGRLSEVEIPTKQSTVYTLMLDKVETKSRTDVCAEARAKIDTILPVTDPRKSLGQDFRRSAVRADWEQIRNDDSLPEQYTIAHFHCVASAGTYMRTLAQEIGKNLQTSGLAWHIHRTKIGRYDQETDRWVETLAS